MLHQRGLSDNLMSTDDRDDVESENPAKSFKVGEVDRLSGFFTPVWESKRRLRADSPVPPSSAAASAPNSSRNAASEKSTPPPAPVAVTRASVPPPAPSNTPAPKPAPARTSSPPPAPRASKPAPAHPPRATKPLGKGGAAAKRAETRAAEKSAAELAATPLVPPAAEAAPGETRAPNPPSLAELAAATAAMKVSGATLRGVATPLPPAAPAPGTNGDTTTPPASSAAPESAAPEAPGAAPDRVAAAFAAAAAVTVRPVIPMPLTPPVRPASRAKPTPVPAPSAAALALKNAGTNLPVDAFLDREPEFRPSSPGTSPPPARAEVDPRALRAAKAATSLHEQLKGKLMTDSVDTFARHRETESEREALQAAAERAAKQPADPYPSHVLRTLRRTIHLSSALPEAVRQMLEKYRY